MQAARSTTSITIFIVRWVLLLVRDLCCLVQQELIQNAEDAGASQVKFLHDEHSHGTSNLYHDGLKEFQVKFLVFSAELCQIGYCLRTTFFSHP